MSTPRSIDELNARACRRHNEHPYLGRDPDPERRSFMYTAAERAPEPLFTSSKIAEGCLTHIARLVVVWPSGINAGRISAHALCGHMDSSPRWVAVADETFVCRRCCARAEHYGLPTFGLIPDTGCAVSGGKRGLNLGKKYKASWRRP